MQIEVIYWVYAAGESIFSALVNAAFFSLLENGLSLVRSIFTFELDLGEEDVIIFPKGGQETEVKSRKKTLALTVDLNNPDEIVHSSAATPLSWSEIENALTSIKTLVPPLISAVKAHLKSS
eukprot:TRINITY_DN4122_c0_g1_i4.p1 TRINITY_DN4122_c0_g1~~TRINITY_DN4122_c0_g1_i4.p1  ORF type:complete len:122 (+),score=7.84 TRINITY_DN4122_c0_g1_i4:377-742(+)